MKDLSVGDFVLDTKMLSTIKDYNHRDLCLFFGYQDPAHFYYVHLGKKTDDHANQIFIVDGSDRKKISTMTTREPIGLMLGIRPALNAMSPLDRLKCFLTI